MSAEPAGARVTIESIKKRKAAEPPLVCLTAYSAYIARLLDKHVDVLLVGDSLGMVLYGMENTHDVTLEMMIAHARAVAQNSAHALTVVDMPRGTYDTSGDALANAKRLIRETGCDGVKLEGGAAHADTVRHLVDNGINVMGHIGILPQSVQAPGGYKVVGKHPGERSALLEDAAALEDAGVFSIVLEGVIEPLAQDVSRASSVPVIGIGASSHCHGQILVTEDMLALTQTPPRFAKQYARVDSIIQQAVIGFAEDVRARRFPSAEHVYHANIEQFPPRKQTAKPQQKKSAANG
ncbi:MAG: 3-methyl-2-oxobutanoate hydroxymethyltransferase [Hyphomicrobiales bacterium]|nr:3-methyl-2-oxobutanoate hydroxymethyltransferase [Hyphomicrobiales bacterium]